MDADRILVRKVANPTILIEFNFEYDQPDGTIRSDQLYQTDKHMTLELNGEMITLGMNRDGGLIEVHYTKVIDQRRKGFYSARDAINYIKSGNRGYSAVKSRNIANNVTLFL